MLSTILRQFFLLTKLTAFGIIGLTINCFVHRASERAVFFSINKIIYTVNASNSIWGQNLQYFFNRHYIWPHLRKMYPKFTCSCRLEISTWNKQVFWCDVYISPQIWILLSKHLLVHRFNKRNTKKYQVIIQRYCNICNTIACMHTLFCRQPYLFWYQQKITCLIEMSNFITGFFWSIGVFYIQHELVEINSLISHKPESKLINEW